MNISRSVLEAADVHKSLANVDVLRGVDLVLEAGEVVGLLGQNGSGKTTLLRVLSGVFACDEGRVDIQVGSSSARPVKRGDVALITEEPGLRAKLTPREELTFVGELFSQDRVKTQARIEDLAEALALGPFLDQRSPSLSKGTRQKIALARALISNRPITLMDEPMANVDDSVKKTGYDLIRNLSSQGSSILISTHILQDLEGLVTRILILYDGKIALNTPPSLLSNCHRSFRFSGTKGTLKMLLRRLTIVEVKARGGV